jgi:hypothetical protein
MSRLGSNTGYPAHVAFHEGRCFFGNIGTDTNVLMGSKIHNILDFENGEGKEGTLTDATALDFTLSEVEAISWINPSQRLIIGATNGVFSLTGSGDTGISPLAAPLFRRIASPKCSTVKPIFFQGVTFFTHSSSKRLGALLFRQGTYSGFEYMDMSLNAYHLTKNGIKELCFLNDVIWLVTNSNELRGLTFNESSKVLAWHKHDSSDLYNSISSTGDNLYIAITRANGQFIEWLNADIQDLDKEDIICVDSSLTYDSTPATIITGLSHLNGEVVDILADGAAHPQKTVSGGSITLDAEASVVHVGLPYTSTLKTTEVVGGNRRGSRESRVTRIHEIGVKFLSSNGAKVQSVDSPIMDIPFNDSQVYGAGPDLFTGTKVFRLNSGNTLNPTVTVTSSGALPVSILGISVDIDVSET